MKKLKILSNFMVFVVLVLSPGLGNSDRVPVLAKLTDIAQGALLMNSEDYPFHQVLPNVRTDVNVSIRGSVASTTVDQVFTNRESTPIEAVYVFPLPENAAVHDVTMIVGNKLIRSIMQERMEAKKTYEEAKREGKRASLSEQERPNIFTISVANIMPKDTIVVRLEYFHRLKYDSGRFEYRFPMVVGPRYIPGQLALGKTGKGWAPDTDSVPDASRITPLVAPPGIRTGNTIYLTLDLDAGLPIEKIRSVSHDISSIEEDQNRRHIQLTKKSEIPNKDFVLEYYLKNHGDPQVTLLTSRKDGDDYFMLMAIPPVDTSEVVSVPKEVIFVLDVSGSMDGFSITQAKASLARALRKLKPVDSYNIICFNDSYAQMSSYPLRATDQNVARGDFYLTWQEADGGTEALPALLEAMYMSHDPDRVKIIIFITDGDVGNDENLINAVRKSIGNARLFSVGIGSAPNSYLLRKTAQLGRGTFTHVSALEDVESRMDELLTKIDSPVLTDLKLKIEGDVELYPNPLPDLFSGEPLTVMGKFTGSVPLSVRLEGKDAESEFTYDLPLNLDSAPKEEAIPFLWARNKVSNLMDEFRLGNEQLKSEIISTALAHRILTKFTSFVAVEQIVVNPSRYLLSKAVPTELPEGWKYDSISGPRPSVKFASLPQTASDAPLTVVVGLILIIFSLVVFLVRKRLP